MARPHAAAASARAATARAPDRVHEEPARHRRAVDARERGRERSDRARVGLDGGAEHDARAARAAAREHARARGADGEDERVVERKRFDAERAARVSDACRVRRAVCDAQARVLERGVVVGAQQHVARLAVVGDDARSARRRRRARGGRERRERDRVEHRDVVARAEQRAVARGATSRTMTSASPSRRSTSTRRASAEATRTRAASPPHHTAMATDAPPSVRNATRSRRGDAPSAARASASAPSRASATHPPPSERVAAAAYTRPSPPLSVASTARA